MKLDLCPALDTMDVIFDHGFVFDAHAHHALSRHCRP